MRNVSDQDMIQESSDRMMKLGMHPLTIEFFKRDKHVMLFHQDFDMQLVIDFDNEHSLAKKIKQMEEEYNIMIYAVIDSNNFGFEMLNFLYVSDEKYNWDSEFEQVDNNKFLTYAYVENLDEPNFSEFGLITISCENEQLKRIR